MHKLYYLFLSSLMSILTLTSCGEDDEGPLASGIYVNCCNTPPVEKDFNPGRVYMTNIFTPNSDGINDFLTVYADEGIEIVEEFKVMNNTGNTIYEEIDFPPNKAEYGWYPQGNENISGLYTYFVRVKNTDGDIHEISGNFCAYICNNLGQLELTDNCGFGTQYDGLGGFDSSLPSMEEMCP